MNLRLAHKQDYEALMQLLGQLFPSISEPPLGDEKEAFVRSQLNKPMEQ